MSDVGEIFVRVVNHWKLGAVIGMMMRDHDCVNVFEADVFLDVGERAGTTVNPKGCGDGLDQISTAGLVCPGVAS